MKKGKLKNGFEYEADETLLDDMEFLQKCADMARGTDPWALFDVIDQVFPGDKRKIAYDFVRDKKTGRVSAEAVGQLMNDVLEDMREDGKNS